MIWTLGGLTTRATPPAEMLVATASINTHGALFNRPKSQKDLAAPAASFVDMQLSFIVACGTIHSVMVSPQALPPTSPYP